MLVRASEHIDGALARLSPDDRALLELSLRRHVSDQEIAGLLNVQSDDVKRRRGRALGRLAEHLDLASTDQLADLLARGWDGAVKPAHRNGAPAPKPSRPARMVVEPVPATRRGRLLLLLALLAAAVVGAIALAISGGNDQGSTSPAAPARPAPEIGAGPSAALAPVGPVRGVRGTARLRGFALSLRTQGLPSGGGDYTVWLYDSVANATPVGRLRAGRLEARLPSGFTRYRYIDVSREPRDGNANHSGASVLRAPLSTLTR
jgi:hypothetical protein